MIRHSFAPFGPDAVQLLTDRIGIDFTGTDFTGPSWLCVTAREMKGPLDYWPLLGACAFEFKTRFDAYFDIAVIDQRCITRKVVRAMFGAVFSQAVRVSAEIRPENQLAVQLALRMGFEVEGFKKLAIEGRWDALQLGMTKDTCRFLRRAQRPATAPVEGIEHGQRPETS